jgi:uncharacterized protein YutE (UPF0331/DUF86 family)
VNFTKYLTRTKQIAKEEKEILDYLSKKGNLSPIEIRATKSSLQVLIENMIGKSKKILKEFDCPIIPQRGRDAIFILYEVGAITHEQYREFMGAIGFRNSMIHDYMDFKVEILLSILREKRYINIYEFLIEEPEYKESVQKRIENFSF